VYVTKEISWRNKKH